MIKLKELSINAIEGHCSIYRKTPSELVTLTNQIQTEINPGNMFMSMFYILSALNQKDAAISMQQKAISYQKVFRLSNPLQPSIRLLGLVGPGDMYENTPLDFLIENKNIRLDLLYLTPHEDFPDEIPEHDVAFVALGESENNLPILKKIQLALSSWPKPVINPAEQLYLCRRDRLFNLLKNVPGLLVPSCIRISKKCISATSLKFPMTIRPIDTHAGIGLHKLNSVKDLDTYLDLYLDDDLFYISDFIDYQSNDGNFRKFRIALIDKKPYICHLAIGDEWIVNYVGAKMYGDAQKRLEESLFMEEFDDSFAITHQHALFQIANKLNLDYVVIDCGLTTDSQLLLFEADGGAWVHSTDPIELFAYKTPVMQKVFDAFEKLLIKRCH